MTAPAIPQQQGPQDDVLAKARRLREAGASIDQIRQYLAAKGYESTSEPTSHNGVPFVDAPEIANKRSAAIGHNGKPFVNATETDSEPDWRDKTLGVVAAVNRDIPFAEAAQAKVRSLVRGQPYRDARNDIRTAEDAAPATARNVARLGGGTLAALRVPGSPVMQGARFGLLSGLGQSDPDLSASDRVRDAEVTGAIGGIGAGALQGLSKLPLGTVRDIALSPVSGGARRRLAVKTVGAFRDALSEAAATPVAPRVASEAVESAGPKSLASISRPLRLVTDAESPASSSVADLVKSAPTRHRTAAQFADFAERSGTTPPRPSSLDAQLAALIKPLRTAQPSEVGSTFGDAEEAMGLAPHQQPDLEDLLRRSIDAAKKSKPTPP